MNFYYVYVLQNKTLDFIYVGFTNNLKRRYEEHNNKDVISTKHFAPLVLIHYEAYKDIRDAKRREEYFKTTKGRTTLKQMIREYLKYNKD